MKQSFLIILFGISITAISGCKKEKPICGCGIEDPIQNIEWLSSTKDYFEKDNSAFFDEVTIYMYDYQNSKAFVFETKKNGLFDYPTSIYDCEGKTIFICGGLQQPSLDSCNIFFQSASNKTLLWKKLYK